MKSEVHVSQVEPYPDSYSSPPVPGTAEVPVSTCCGLGSTEIPGCSAPFRSDGSESL